MLFGKTGAEALLFLVRAFIVWKEVTFTFSVGCVASELILAPLMSSDVLEASRERRLAELEFVEAAYPDAAIDYAPGMSDGAGFSFWVRMEYDAAVVDHLDSSSDDDYAPKIAAPLPHVPCLIEENIVKLTVRMPLLYPEECGPEVSLSEWQPLKMVETANDGVTQAALALNGFKTSDRVRVVNEDERGKVLERLKTEAAEAPGEERSLQVRAMCYLPFRCVVSNVPFQLRVSCSWLPKKRSKQQCLILAHM